MTRNEKADMERLINRLWETLDKEPYGEDAKHDAAMRLQGIDKALYILNYRIIYDPTIRSRRIVTIGQYARMFS